MALTEALEKLVEEATATLDVFRATSKVVSNAVFAAPSLMEAFVSRKRREVEVMELQTVGLDRLGRALEGLATEQRALVMEQRRAALAAQLKALVALKESLTTTNTPPEVVARFQALLVTQTVECLTRLDAMTQASGQG